MNPFRRGMAGREIEDPARSVTVFRISNFEFRIPPKCYAAGMRTGFRFDPPKIELDAETAWVFARAFGPADKAFAGKVDGLRAVDAADGLALTARIGARVGAATLAGEVGEGAAGAFSDRYRQAAARAVAQEALCRQLAEAGAELGVPTIFLKGAALQLAGFTQPGSRESCDVDVLVPIEAAVGYQQGLVDDGYREERGVASEHQLLPLYHSSGLMVEVHTLVRGVRVGEDGGSATGEMLLKQGLCRTPPGFPDGVLIPTDGVLACHLMVHGISQHGLSPGSYPISRLLADVQDLSASAGVWDELWGGAFEWIAEDVSREEIEAAVDLAGRLGRGEDSKQLAEGNDAAALLLRHTVAGAQNEGYRHALKLRHYSDPLASSRKVTTLLSNTVRAFWINDHQVDLLYGKPKTSLGYVGWKLWRPFDLVGRAARYGRAWFRHRFRR